MEFPWLCTMRLQLGVVALRSYLDTSETKGSPEAVVPLAAQRVLHIDHSTSLLLALQLWCSGARFSKVTVT